MSKTPDPRRKSEEDRPRDRKRTARAKQETLRRRAIRRQSGKATR